MQSKVEQSARTKMQELRLICDKEIPIQQQKIDSAVLSFRRSLETLQSKAHKTVENQGPFWFLVLGKEFWIWLLVFEAKPRVPVKITYSEWS